MQMPRVYSVINTPLSGVACSYGLLRALIIMTGGVPSARERPAYGFTRWTPRVVLCIHIFGMTATMSRVSR